MEDVWYLDHTRREEGKDRARRNERKDVVGMEEGRKRKREAERGGRGRTVRHV